MHAVLAHRTPVPVPGNAASKGAAKEQKSKGKGKNPLRKGKSAKAQIPMLLEEGGSREAHSGGSTDLSILSSDETGR